MENSTLSIQGKNGTVFKEIYFVFVHKMTYTVIADTF